ncbi:pyridoxamine 5'-phosphate oxidase family protein [Pontibacter sp. FD36]|uniref:General stress protein 26 n=1 Tax=Pontibacter lucknowensis TaxID=1077936 RepID=A0A1N6X2Z8_9BACT|nr:MULTISPECIES: pyridoxamine 5'-phosphate oxidase family protein [Pontibacter]EJF08966.1 pyridoxamine 5'-phosphate oxidase [Pontibacter sp. BAB1700]MBF8962478.1 pyridoxamine 5'-phosphate oxidase family protein [Pontibacter sp. FD36]SIQ96655.1 General stress protein 26 [Pontibacter lucknowensis]
MNNDRTEKLQTLIDKIKDVDTAMMSTMDEDGSIRSRPMRNQQIKDDGAIWFFTGYESGKSHEIKNDSHVNLSYAKPSDNLYVSVSGKATLTKDKAKIDELWTPAMKAWFPEGKDDPNIGLIKVTIDKAEYWDSPNSAVVHLIGMAKAAITGERYKTGDHDKMNL